jgi:hypothetical protein
LNSPGLALALAMNSAMVPAKSGFASIRLGEVASSEIGVKSLAGSKGTLRYSNGFTTSTLDVSRRV